MAASFCTCESGAASASSCIASQDERYARTLRGSVPGSLNLATMMSSMWRPVFALSMVALARSQVQ
ncbi:hypothetical protein C7T35_31835 [Variovorax sp. WS11]|nr:hypothetical protein C7T35_31835 [Variovorax sp. WS11]